MPRPRRVLGSVVFTAIAAAVVYFTWPSSLGGCTTLTIVSGHSMEPTYYTDDLVVARCARPEVGDVAVYASADTGGAQIVHRVIGGDGESGWELQGDNNDWVDQFRPTDDEVAGVVVLHVPKAGKVAKAASRPVVWASLFVLALALVTWPSKRDEDDEDDESGADDGRSAADDGVESIPAVVAAPRVVDDFRMEDLDEYVAARRAEPLPEDVGHSTDVRVDAALGDDLDEFIASLSADTVPADQSDDCAVAAGRPPVDPVATLRAQCVSVGGGDDWWTEEIERLVFPDGGDA